MKLTFLPALAAVLILACASASAQTTTAAPAAPAPAAAPSTKSMTTPYKGTITAISATSLTVQGAKESMTMAITSDTKLRGAKMITDFAVGDMITGSYTKDDSGAMTAHSIHKKKMKK